MTYLDVWKSGILLEKPQVSVLPITNMNRRTTERSTSCSLGDVSWVQKAALQLYRRNVPLLNTFRYAIARDSFLPGFPRISTASDKRWGEKPWVRGYAHCCSLMLSSTFQQDPPGCMALLLRPFHQQFSMVKTLRKQPFSGLTLVMNYNLTLLFISVQMEHGKFKMSVRSSKINN